MIRRAGIAAFIVALMLPGAVMALTPQGQQMLRRWTAADRCAQQAQKAFPDYTAEANAKRDAAMRTCLAITNMPPRESLDHADPNPAKP